MARKACPLLKPLTPVRAQLGIACWIDSDAGHFRHRCTQAFLPDPFGDSRKPQAQYWCGPARYVVNIMKLQRRSQTVEDSMFYMLLLYSEQGLEELTDGSGT